MSLVNNVLNDLAAREVKDKPQLDVKPTMTVERRGLPLLPVVVTALVVVATIYAAYQYLEAQPSSIAAAAKKPLDSVSTYAEPVSSPGIEESPVTTISDWQVDAVAGQLQITINDLPYDAEVLAQQQQLRLRLPGLNLSEVPLTAIPSLDWMQGIELNNELREANLIINTKSAYRYQKSSARVADGRYRLMIALGATTAMPANTQAVVTPAVVTSAVVTPAVVTPAVVTPAVVTPAIEKPATSTKKSPSVVATNHKQKIPPVLSARQLDLKVFKEAEKFIRSGDTRKAESKLREQLAHQEKSPKSEYLLISLYLSQGRNQHALSRLDEARQKYPDSVAYENLEARALIAEQHPGLAYELLLPRIETGSGDLESLEIFAVTAQQLGKHSEAGTVYESLVRQNPQRSDWWVGWGISLEAQSKIKEAIVAYQRALNLPAGKTTLSNFAKQRLAELTRS